jgi:peptide/nickel transport system permease protein
MIPVLIGASFITFSISHVFRDPVYGYVNPANLDRVTDEDLQAIRASHGLDGPVFINIPWLIGEDQVSDFSIQMGERGIILIRIIDISAVLENPLIIIETQYLYYLRDLITLDWGYTTADGNRPVLESLTQRFPATLELTVVAMFFALVAGIPIGVISAIRKDKAVDHVSRFLALSGVSLPVFWLGLIMQLIFGYMLNLLPNNQRIDTLASRTFPITEITGLHIIDSILNLFGFQYLWTLFFNTPAHSPVNAIYYLISALQHILMPAIALSWISIAIFARMMRTSMLETMKQDYITLARSKGLSERVVIYKHALRNAIIPTLTVAGLSFAGLLGGAVLTETVFSWPGIGSWAVAAVVQSDSNGIVGIVVFVAAIYVLMNLLIDILYTLVDPRIDID